MSDHVLDRARALLKDSELSVRSRGVELLSSLSADGRATALLVELLEESSWYLRERAVEALRDRPEAGPAVLRVLAEGSWYARASACEVLGFLADPASVRGVLEQVEDRNVSLQKSAVSALASIAKASGDDVVAVEIASLPPKRRSRVLARIGHQSPEWGASLGGALARRPAEELAPEPRAVAAPEAEVETPAIVRFRKWLARLPDSGVRGE